VHVQSGNHLDFQQHQNGRNMAVKTKEKEPWGLLIDGDSCCAEISGF